MVSKTQSAWDDNSELAADRAHLARNDYPALTSITARTMLTVSVSMSVTEMDQLINSFGKSVHELSDNQRAIHAEFIAAIESVK